MTNAEKIRSLTDEELAMFLDEWERGGVNTGVFFCAECATDKKSCCWKCMEYWLTEEDANESEYETLFREKRQQASKHEKQLADRWK